jgi:hypothetical protein
MLEKLIELKNTSLSLNYNTNFSTINLGSKNIFDYWKHFKDLNVFLSYDGFGEKGEYIRNGMDWNLILENHRKLQSHSHINFFVTPTISVLNAFHLPDLVMHLVDEELINDGNQLILNILQSPEFYNITIFTQSEKDALIKNYQNFITQKVAHFKINHKEQIIEQFEILMNYVKAENTNMAKARKHFLMQTVSIDKIRQEKMLSLFPELVGFYQ